MGGKKSKLCDLKMVAICICCFCELLHTAMATQIHQNLKSFQRIYPHYHLNHQLK